MKIVLTGGTGLVGKELGKALAAKGHDLIVLSRKPETSHIYCPYPHRSFYWDALKGEPDPKIWEGADGVIHLSGENIAAKRWTASFKEKLYKTRVFGTKSLVHAVREHAPHLKFFISTSAAGYYAPSMTPLKEEAPPGNSFLSNICKDWEESVLKELPTNVRSLIFRLGVVFAEKGGALWEMADPIKKTFGVSLGSGKQLLNWIDIEDVLGAYLWALDSNEEGIFNLASPGALSNKEITKCIADYFSKISFGSVPSFLVRIALGEMADLLTLSQSMSMEKIQAKGFSFRYSNIKDSLQKNLHSLKPGEEFFFQEQWIPKDREKVFSFFSDENNLEKLTPSWLKFRVLSKSTPSMGKGTEINYSLRWHGIPLRWQSRIEAWDPPHVFSDNQVKGPYSRWYHQHLFHPLGEGTLVGDMLSYALPLSPLSSILMGKKIGKDVKAIFLYRAQKLATLDW